MSACLTARGHAGPFGSREVVGYWALAEEIVATNPALRWSPSLGMIVLLGDPIRALPSAKLSEGFRASSVPYLRALAASAESRWTRVRLEDTARMLDRREVGHASYVASVAARVRDLVPVLSPEEDRRARADYYAKRAAAREWAPKTSTERSREFRAAYRDGDARMACRAAEHVLAALPPGRYSFRDLWAEHGCEALGGRNTFYANIRALRPDNVGQHARELFLTIEERAA